MYKFMHTRILLPNPVLANAKFCRLCPSIRDSGMMSAASDLFMHHACSLIKDRVALEAADVVEGTFSFVAS